MRKKHTTTICVPQSCAFLSSKRISEIPSVFPQITRNSRSSIHYLPSSSLILEPEALGQLLRKCTTLSLTYWGGKTSGKSNKINFSRLFTKKQTAQKSSDFWNLLRLKYQQLCDHTYILLVETSVLPWNTGKSHSSYHVGGFCQLELLMFLAKNCLEVIHYRHPSIFLTK